MKKIYIRGERWRLHNKITIDKVTEEVIQNAAGFLGIDYEFKLNHFKLDYESPKYNMAWIATIPCGFDIETYEQYMYIWTFTLRDLTIIGYTWEEFALLLKTIQKALNLYRDVKVTKHRDGTSTEKQSAAKLLPIYIHNIEFEWSFLRSILMLSEKPFYLDEDEKYDPLYGISDDSFLWMDSYKVYPMKLEEVAKTYCITQKAVGQLDYDKPRNYEDAKHLTDEELEYCCNDTIILSELMKFTFKNYFLVTDKMPMTQNQIVKSLIKKEWKTKYNAMTDKEKSEHIKYIHSLMLDQYQYGFIRTDGFRGGVAQARHEGITETKDGEIIISADITSAYFTVIMHKKFPMQAYQLAPEKGEDLKTLLDSYYAPRFCCQIRARFKNLRCKGNKMIKLESRSKIIAFLPNGQVAKNEDEMRQIRKSIDLTDSGRVFSAANIIVSLTEIDYELYQKVYEWDDMEVLEIQYAIPDYLPDYVRDAAIKLYEKKAALKKAGKTKTPEYRAAKTLVSNLFGAIAQKIDKLLVETADEYTWEKKTKDNILKAQWGVYVSAHVRKILVDMILAIGPTSWLYSDTDSIYFVLSDSSKKVIDLYNAKQRLRNAILCNERGLNYALFDDLGCFDDESSKHKVIYHFKAIGTKSYLYYYTDDAHPQGSFELVLAGIPEDYFWTAYRKKYPTQLTDKKEEIKRVFKFFDKKTPIAYERTMMDFNVDNTSKEINGIMCYCKTGCKLVKQVIHGTIEDVQDRIALEEAFNDISDERV